MFIINSMEQQTKINFDPVEHKYTDDNGLVYTSVTTVIGKYKPKFNQKYWAMYTALKEAGFKVRPDFEKNRFIVVNGITRTIDSLYSEPVACFEVELVLQKWANLTKAACDRGNEIHDFLEDNINDSKEGGAATNAVIKPSLGNQSELLEIKTVHELDQTAVKDRYPSIYKTLKNLINKGLVLYAEKRIYSTTYQIAGMIDVLAVYHPTKKFMILDWKTNKDEMLFTSGYFKKTKIQGKYVKTDTFVPKQSYLKAPLNNIEDCKGMIYSLQLSLYAFIMELWGYKLVKDGLWIYHLRPGLEPKLMGIRYMKKEIQLMLNHHIGKHAGQSFGIR